jgi:putative ABC transport system permease protein
MILRIAFRNLFRQRRRTVLTLLTMLGGFSLCSVSIAWMDGAYGDVIDQFTRTRLGHIQIHHKDYRDRPKLQRNIKDAESIGRFLDGVERIEGWTWRLFGSGLGSVGSRSAGMQCIGIDPPRENTTTNFENQIKEGRPLSHQPGQYEALLGRGLARRLTASPGDTLVILSQGADGSMANDLFRIVGIVESGNSMADQSTVYIHIADAQEFFVIEGRVHQMILVANSPRDLFPLAEQIRNGLQLPELVVEPWQVFAKSFYDAMQEDQNGAWISLFVIMLVVSVGVLNTILMSVLERTREYGLLIAMGTRPTELMTMVISEVMFLALLGIALGTLLSLGVNYWMTLHGISLPDTLSYGGVEFREMHAEMNLRSFVIPAVVVFLSSLLVAILPAARAARVAPAQAMRTI